MTPPPDGEGSVDGDSYSTPPTTLNSATQTRKPKQLHVVHKQNSEGKILYMSARQNHFSYCPESSLWRIMLPEDVRVLEMELRRALKPTYERYTSKDGQDYLRVAMGHMLERIVYWDRDEAIKFEAEHESKALSTIPLLEDTNTDKMRHIVEKFRVAIRRLKNSDWRRPWGELHEETLYGLLRFTFLNARPVLAWELDFDKVG